MKQTLFILLAFLLVGCQITTPIPSVSPEPSQIIQQDACTTLTVTDGPAPNLHATDYCVLNPDVTQDTINKTICVSGWTSTIRPSSSSTNAIKLKLIADGQNLVSGDTNSSDYELDHRMPLELGGAPKDFINLSIEYPRSVNSKDLDENYYKKQVCSGAMTLLQAQLALTMKWLGPYPQYKE